jgi:septum site-determining protein MinD
MDTNSTEYFPKSIAIVSAKGGSGKTMIAACIAKIFSINKIKTTLVDGDIATGGLTYYLGLKNIENISLGLSNILLVSESQKYISPSKCVQKLIDDENIYFVGVGDHRRLFKEHSDIDFSGSMKKLLFSVDSEVVIVDCRGGIDKDSLDICRAVDEIIVIVETDTTSFQATQYLVDILREEQIAYKIKGFIVNKVFDDPSGISRSGTASFRSQYLGSIPFDFSATRTFLIGEIPSKRGQFFIQLSAALKKAYPQKIIFNPGRVLDFSEFKEISLKSIDSIRGGMFLSFLLIAFYSLFLWGKAFGGYYSGDYSFLIENLTTIIAVLGLCSSIDSLRSIIGQMLSLIIDHVKTKINLISQG